MKDIFNIPSDFTLKINEISNNAYEIELVDNQERKVVSHGANLKSLVSKAIEDLKKMNR